MDSMNMGLLMNMNDSLKKKEGKLVIVNPNKVADDIFQLSDAQRFLDIQHNVKNIDIVFD
jgi:anti-anti-sigma regulatory factor